MLSAPTGRGPWGRGPKVSRGGRQNRGKALANNTRTISSALLQRRDSLSVPRCVASIWARSPVPRAARASRNPVAMPKEGPVQPRRLVALPAPRTSRKTREQVQFVAPSRIVGCRKRLAQPLFLWTVDLHGTRSLALEKQSPDTPRAAISARRKHPYVPSAGASAPPLRHPQKVCPWQRTMLAKPLRTSRASRDTTRGRWSRGFTFEFFRGHSSLPETNGHEV